MNEIIEIKIQCPECKGTGLYVGMAERDGAAVVCYKCKGTGMYTYKYKPFTERKLRDGVVRVYKGSFGFVHSAEDAKDSNGKLIEFSEGGCSYNKWLQGDEPKPVKELYCPFMWTSQKLKCDIGPAWGILITKCKHFKNKEDCWQKYESGEWKEASE